MFEDHLRGEWQPDSCGAACPLNRDHAVPAERKEAIFTFYVLDVEKLLQQGDQRAFGLGHRGVGRQLGSCRIRRRRSMFDDAAGRVPAVRKDVECAQRRVDPVRKGLEDAHGDIGEDLAGRGVVEVGVDDDPQDEVSVDVDGVVEVEVHERDLVELRDVPERGGTVFAERFRRRPMTHMHHDLEQWVPGQRPRRIQGLDEPFEGHTLMSDGVECRVAHPLEDSPRRRITRQVAAQHDDVGEQTDHLVGRLTEAIGHRSADREIVTGTECVQHTRPDRLAQHELGGAHALGVGDGPVPDLRRNPPRGADPVVPQDLWSRMVVRDIDLVG